MNKSIMEIPHQYNIGDIIELKNKNNNKSIFCKVNNIELSFDMSSGTTTINDKIKYAYFMGCFYGVKLYYKVITLDNSYYDTEDLELLPTTNLTLNLD